MVNSIRIIGGLYRGKKIKFPIVRDLRPTPNRVKETLFNWLMHDIRDARCLDAFAGSGSLGFEAFSRGAKQVVMLESSPIVVKSLQPTILSFNTSKLHIINTRAEEYLQTTKESYNIIFLDPPFKSNYLSQCLVSLEIGTCLVSGGLVYIEAPKKIILDSNIWYTRQSKQAGQVYYALFEKIARS